MTSGDTAAPLNYAQGDFGMSVTDGCPFRVTEFHILHFSGTFSYVLCSWYQDTFSRMNIRCGILAFALVSLKFLKLIGKPFGSLSGRAQGFAVIDLFGNRKPTNLKT